jgi:hypothetical protein
MLTTGLETNEALAMNGYGQYCPLAKGAEVFAERWTPLILRYSPTCRPAPARGGS